MSPSLKLYFINKDVVYEGMYDRIDLRPNHMNTAPEAGDGNLLDLVGHDTPLTR